MFLSECMFCSCIQEAQQTQHDMKRMHEKARGEMQELHEGKIAEMTQTMQQAMQLHSQTDSQLQQQLKEAMAKVQRAQQEQQAKAQEASSLTEKLSEAKKMHENSLAEMQRVMQQAASQHTQSESQLQARLEEALAQAQKQEAENAELAERLTAEKAANQRKMQETNKETEDRLNEMRKAVEQHTGNDSKLQSQLKLLQAQNADLHSQVAALTSDLQDWIQGKAGNTQDAVGARGCDGRDQESREIAVGGEAALVTRIEELEEQNEAMRREVEETDDALRSAEARIAQLEFEQGSDRQREELMRGAANEATKTIAARDSEIAKLKLELQRSHLQLQHQRDVNSASTDDTQGSGGVENDRARFEEEERLLAEWHQVSAARNPRSVDFAPLEACIETEHEWEDGEASRADVQRLSALLKQEEDLARRKEQQMQRERQQFHVTLADKDSVIQQIEQQLTTSSREAMQLAQGLKEQVAEVNRLQQEIQQLKQRPPPQVAVGGNAASVYAEIARLTQSLQQTVAKDPFFLEQAVINDDATETKQRRNQTTLGLMMKMNSVEDVVVGGPAFNCQRIHRGDILTMVNGQELKPTDSVAKMITGDDLVGSSVTLRFQKLTGVVYDVELVRMPYERVSARRRIHELFLELRKAAVATRDGNTASKVDLIINLWNQMMHAEAQVEGSISSSLRSRWHQAQSMAKDMLETLKYVSTPPPVASGGGSVGSGGGGEPSSPYAPMQAPSPQHLMQQQAQQQRLSHMGGGGSTPQQGTTRVVRVQQASPQTGREGGGSGGRTAARGNSFSL